MENPDKQGRSEDRRTRAGTPPRGRPKRTLLPDVVYRELVDMLFSMTLPVVAMGVVVTGVGAMLALQWGDPMVIGLTAGSGIVTLLRLITLRGYRRQDPATMDLATIRRWERRYAIGNYAFAGLLGLLNARMLMFHLPVVHMITVSLVFVFGAGVVSRIAIRPRICVTSLLLAVVPTAVALGLHAFMNNNGPLHTQLFAVEALLVAGTLALCLQSVAHLYRSMVKHLTAEHDLSLLAKRDALTDLPNRLLLRERFQANLATVAQGGGRLALHCLDLDGFKPVNDVHGHPAGDALLREVARRLTAAVRADDTIARIGGDEFVVVQTGLEHDSEAEMLARRIIKQLSQPYEIDGKTIRIAASVGIALAPEQGMDLERLISCADRALYQAKRAGKGQLRFGGAEEPAAGLREVAA
ncbi:MAG: GGDEF domain-containing protein [Sphingomonas sp.]|jgi:diguanylate cyclase (GGDEF)-like protein|uniref:diguanylate cyclase domain-containing protein n=1 Tax=Sphingomonas sp. TaxID=28214 RepID=UPI003564CB32